MPCAPAHVSDDREILFEITRIGDSQRVAAVDSNTGVEVVVQTPLSASLADARALALRKLERALKASEGAPQPPRSGKFV